MIDLNALRAEVQMAQQSGRKMCTIATDELDSLLSRAVTLATVQDMIPMRIGFAAQEDVHLMMQGEKFRIGLQRKKGPRYQVEVLCAYLPDGRRKAPKIDLNRLLEEAD
jgi:hypothetical protein